MTGSGGGGMAGAAADAGLRHLLGRLAVVEQRVRALVAARRATDPAPDDPFRGLYLSDAVVDAILEKSAAPVLPSGPASSVEAALAEVERGADAAEAAGARLPLREVARRFGLPPLALDVLLVALAPDVDARFERLYGYLNDDVSQRRATMRLAFDLHGVPAADASARACLDERSVLVERGLIAVEEAHRPFLTRVLRVPDPVVAHLLGGQSADPDLADLLVPCPRVSVAGAAPLARALRAGAGLAYVREASGAAGPALAAAALTEAGWETLRLDLTRTTGADPVTLRRAVSRAAGLRGAGVVAGPVEARPDLVAALAALPVPVVLLGAGSWDPRWTPVVPFVVEAAALPDAERRRVWSDALDGALVPGLDPVLETTHFRLGPEQIARAAAAARLAAVAGDRPVTGDLLRAGARGANAAGLERLARRVVPAVGWDDLVLPETVLDRLRDLARRARHRGRVLGEWAMRPGGGRGTGVTALLTGESGTGKTMAAEVVAGDLGLDLYVVDLATVVDKYVGETEKNLDRIFTEAAGVNGVLLFDEADAVFGKRSEVRDAHDRYANVETAYLLQRMETFDGLAILTTNLRGNVDEAFTRRLDLVVEFPRPDATARLALWQRCLGRAPREPGLDLAELAGYELAGGDIRSAALTAAYLAATDDRPVSMPMLRRAVDTEYRKLGRLV